MRMTFSIIILVLVFINVNTIPNVVGDCKGSTTDTLVFKPGLLPYHKLGHKYHSTAWEVTVQDPHNDYMTYGPNTPQVPIHRSRVDFLLEIDNNNHDNAQILTLDVNDAETSTVLASRIVLRTDFSAASAPQNFSLFFQNSRCSKKLEFRVFYVCCAKIIHYETIVRPLDSGPFGSFWIQQSHFKFISQANFPTPGHSGTDSTNVGTYFVPLNGIWYLFYREQDYVPTPSYCQHVIQSFRVLVTNSTDRGVTWSTPALVAQPTPKGPDECAIVDGTAFYDEKTTTWHYLGQCIARSGGWSMCHYYLHLSSPYGAWKSNAKNPVVRGGQLWSQICAGSSKHCTSGTVDEGTPDIVEKRDGYFYVTFHGYDNNAKKAARGVARTADFVNWQISGFSLPGDSIFSPLDCNPWNISWAAGGCVGGGEGSIMKSGDYYYMLIEAPDVSLSCNTQRGVQNWVLGFMRSPSLYFPSGQWERFVIDPTIVPKEKFGCALQYHRIFFDSHGIYLSYWFEDFTTKKAEMKVFVLEPGYQPLPIIASL